MCIHYVVPSDDDKIILLKKKKNSLLHSREKVQKVNYGEEKREEKPSQEV